MPVLPSFGRYVRGVSPDVGRGAGSEEIKFVIDILFARDGGFGAIGFGVWLGPGGDGECEAISAFSVSFLLLAGPGEPGLADVRARFMYSSEVLL